ncbi:MAG: hypothetical protein IJ993_00395 [Akkermansia sp.]|nr:hypothetical protein [Akkermansia sp.]
MKAITSILAGVVAMVAAVAPQAQADRLSDKPAERIKLLDKDKTAKILGNILIH